VDDPFDRRPSPVRIGIGCVFGALTAVALAITGFGFLAYLFARDLDLDLDFGVDVEGLSPPSAEWVSGIDVATGEPRWAREFGAGTEPVGIGADVLVLRRAQSLVAVDVASGEPRWQRDLGPSVQVVALTDSAVVFADGASLVAIDPSTGAERWRAERAPLHVASIAVAGDVAVVVMSGGEIHAVDTASGALRWSTTVELDSTGTWSGTVLGDIVVVQDGTTAVALEASSGAVRWVWAPPAEHVDAYDPLRGYLDPPISAGPVVGLQILDPPTGGAPTTSTVFVDAITGQERWRTASGALSSFSFDSGLAAGGMLFENGEGGRLLARDPLTGAVRLEIEMMSGRMLAVGAEVFVADDNLIVAVESSTGAPRWTRDVGEDRDGTPLGVVGGVVVVAGDQVPES
jgi:outer membrane protein assembly factor BamB